MTVLGSQVSRARDRRRAATAPAREDQRGHRQRDQGREHHDGDEAQPGAAEQFEVLHHADPGRHEQQRQMLQQPVGGIAERSRQRRARQHQREQQDHADTGPGKGRSRLRTTASPVSWQTSSAVIAANMRTPRGRGKLREASRSYPCFSASCNPVCLQQAIVTTRPA